MPKTISNLQTKITWGLPLFFIFYSAVLCTITLWNIQREGDILWMLWAIQALPLLVFLPGLVKKYYRSYSWFCFLLLLYFVIAVEGSFKSNAALSDHLFLAFVSILFCLSMMASRWLQHALYQNFDKNNAPPKGDQS